MPAEMTLLSEGIPLNDLVVKTAAQLHPDGSYVEYRGGEIRHFISAEGRTLLTMFRTRPVELGHEAAQALVHPPTSFSLWTDITVPFGDDGRGRALALAIAEASGGRLIDRF